MQEFAVNAVTALHLNELAQYVPNLNVWLLYLFAGLGLLCCFFGYRLRNLWFAAVCLVFGCIVGSVLYSYEILDINFSIACGLMTAALFVFTYRLAAPEIGFCIAFFFSVSVNENIIFMFWGGKLLYSYVRGLAYNPKSTYQYIFFRHFLLSRACGACRIVLAHTNKAIICVFIQEILSFYIVR